MQLSKTKLTLLSILTEGSSSFRDIYTFLSALKPKTFSTYFSLRMNVLYHLRGLMVLGLVERKGENKNFIYSITSKGIQELASNRLREFLSNKKSMTEGV